MNATSWAASFWHALPRSVRVSLTLGLYLLSYFLLDTVSQTFSVGSGVSVWYLPTALNLLILFVFGLKKLPFVFSAVLLVQLVNDASHPFFSSLIDALSYSLIYGCTAYALRKLHVDPRLRRLRDVAWFMLFGAFLAPLAAGLTSVTNFSLFGVLDWSEWPVLVFQNAAGDATGVGALAPFVLVLLRYTSLPASNLPEPDRGDAPEVWRWPGTKKFFRILLFAGFLALAAFLAYATPQTLTLDHSYVTFIPVLLIAGWYGFGWAAATTFFMNICIALFTFPKFGNVDDFALQFGLLTLTHLGILLGALVSERKRATEGLHYVAYHDILTGLPNRALFLERLERAAAQAEAGVKQVAVLFIDLDRFKGVNDALGHAAGDAVLVEAARRLEHCLRPEDTVARLGGDEFTVLLEVDAPQDAVRVAERIQQAFAPPFELQQVVHLGASIGVAVSTPERALKDRAEDDFGGEQTEALLRNADTALRFAKTLGRGNYAVFDPAMYTRQLARRRLESDLEGALKRRELILHYQPIVSLGTQKIVGVEALLRWQQPERGLVSPEDFIPVAEQTGLIIPMGSWVVEQALSQLKGWREAGRPDLFMSVNVSARQLQHPQLVEMIRGTLERLGLPPSCATLELTESIFVEEADENTARFKTLYDLGVGLSIDDFGTGYSSLSYLKRLPVHTLKIDRSFLQGVPESKSDTAIVKTILAMAYNLDLDVVAEGVETPAQAEFLRIHGCTRAQGYLFGRPVPAEVFTSLLETSEL